MTDTVPASPASRGVLIVGGTGAVVALLVGTYGRVHDPTGEQTITLFFSGTLNFKAWATTGALVLAVVQLLSALRLYGRIRVRSATPAWLGDAHRLSGTLAFFLTLPVAYHCLWALGFESDLGEPRRFVHSILGCIFYGAFVTKVLAVRIHRLPGWSLPAAGGAVFAALVGLWLTSSLWFFTSVGFPEV